MLPSYFTKKTPERRLFVVEKLLRVLDVFRIVGQGRPKQELTLLLTSRTLKDIFSLQKAYL